MNCPGHILIYKSTLHSYKDLPIRYCEFGTVYRYERSGVLHGLLRVRGFTQDDAHIFCTPEQMEDEIINVLNLTIKLLSDFGFKEYDIRLSTRPEKFVGKEKDWERAENSLKLALEKMNLNYQIDPTEGVFYGPKIDIKIKDCLKRAWQCSTIQLDFNLPQRFNITFRDKQSKGENVVMIHRALMGSLERFIGILIEHYAGWLPLWLAPVQVKVLSISQEQISYAKEVYEKLKKENIRCELDISDERLGYKLRSAITEKIPYALIVGKEEQKTNKVAVRKRDADLGKTELSSFIKQIHSEVSNKT
jgi:threonyl-tRNA synthetase